MNINSMFNGNAPSPFENPMLKAAGITAPGVHPIQKAAEASQANNVAASDPIAIVNAPSAATIKSFDALKTDSRAPINTPVQPVTAPVQPTGMFRGDEIDGAFKAPTAAEVKAEQVSNSVLDSSFAGASLDEMMGTDIRQSDIMKNPTELAAEPERNIYTGEYDTWTPSSEFAGSYVGGSVDTPDESPNEHEVWTSDNAIRDTRAGLDSLATNYVLDNTLPFDMTEKVGEEEGNRRRDIVNDFITTSEFTQGYEQFKAEARAAGQTEDEGWLQKAYANANGIHNSYSLEMGNDGLFKYDAHETDALSSLVKVAVVGGLTFGIGATLAPAFTGLGGLGVPATDAIAQATVNGLATAAQGGDLSDVLTSATLGGVGKYATGLSEAAEAATAADTIGGLGDISGFNDTLGSMGTVSAETASLASRAEVVNRINSGLQGIKALDDGNIAGVVAGGAGASGMFSGDTLSKIETGADTINAVENKDILGVVSGGLKLADLKAPKEYAEDYLTKEFKENDWVMNNVPQLSAASIKLVDELTKGESLEDAVVSSAVKYAKDGGGLSQLFPDGGDDKSDSFKIPLDFLDPLLELGRQIDKNILQPVKDDVTTLVRETGRTIREAVPDVDIDLPDVDTSGFKLPSLDLDIDLSSFKLPSISFSDLDLDFSGFDMPSLSMPDIDIDMPSVSLPDFPDFNFPKWESSPDSSDSSEGLDIEAPEVGFDFNASAGREAERTANAERTKAEDFERLDISNYFSNPLLR